MKHDRAVPSACFTACVMDLMAVLRLDVPGLSNDLPLQLITSGCNNGMLCKSGLDMDVHVIQAGHQQRVSLLDFIGNLVDVIFGEVNDLFSKIPLPAASFSRSV